MPETGRLIVTYLANAIWQIAVIALVCAVLLRIARGASAKYQHAIWVAALVLGLALPALSIVRGYSGHNTATGASHLGQPQAPRPIAQPGITTGKAGSGGEIPLWAEILRPGTHPLPVRTGFVFLFASAYVAFLAFRVVRFGYAWRSASRLAASGAPGEFTPLMETASERSLAAFGVNARILFSPIIKEPCTVGVFQHVIILPTGLASADDGEMLTSVVGHELAHIKRRDFALNLIYELLYLPISFHPAAALMKRRIAQTRELACDELVTERLLGRSEYARALVTVASRVTGSGRPSYTLGVFDADNLEERVMKLTDNKPRLSARIGKVVLLSAATVLLATGAVASAYSLNAGPAISTGSTGAKQDEAQKKKVQFEVTTKDGVVYVADKPRSAPDVDLTPLVGTWKGSYDVTPSELEASSRHRLRNPDIKLIHSDVQINFSSDNGSLVAKLMTYQKITRTSGEETFAMNQSEMVNPQFDGVTVTTATEGQQRENESEQERTGTLGTRYFKIRLIADGLAEAWNGSGNEESPHIVLRRDVPRDEPRAGSGQERRK